MAACKRVNFENGALSYERAPFDPDGLWYTPDALSGSTRTLIKLYKENSARWSYVKYSCMHCQEPSCVSVCPVSAMTKKKVTGIVEYDKMKSAAIQGCHCGQGPDPRADPVRQLRPINLKDKGKGADSLTTGLVGLAAGAALGRDDRLFLRPDPAG